MGLYFYHGFEHILNEKSVRPSYPLKVFGGFENWFKKCYIVPMRDKKYIKNVSDCISGSLRDKDPCLSELHLQVWYIFYIYFSLYSTIIHFLIILRFNFSPIYRIHNILSIRGKLFTERTDGRIGKRKHGISSRI